MLLPKDSEPTKAMYAYTTHSKLQSGATSESKNLPQGEAIAPQMVNALQEVGVMRAGRGGGHSGPGSRKINKEFLFFC